MNLNIRDAIKLQEHGRLKAAEKLLRDLLAEIPEHPEATHQCGLLAFERREFSSAFSLLEASIKLSPGNVKFKENLSEVRKQHHQKLQIVEFMESEVESNPQDYVRMNTLVAAYLDAAKIESAKEIGQASLTVQDSLKIGAIGDKNIIRKRAKPQFNVKRPERNIISFSLWGSDAYYVDGAIENACLAKTFFPGWRCRFYLDDSISDQAITDLEKQGAEVVKMPSNGGGKFGLFWRFFVASDPNVDFFLCRDCDCRLNSKEQAAVEEWLKLGGLFHVMRDNISHLMLIPAGLWGGVGGLLPNIERLAMDYYQRHYQVSKKRSEWIDQEFLADEIWPLIAARTLTHDSYFRVGSTRKFPSDGGMVAPAHVGGAIPRPGENRYTARRSIRV